MYQSPERGPVHDDLLVLGHNRVDEGGVRVSQPLYMFAFSLACPLLPPCTFHFRLPFFLVFFFFHLWGRVWYI